MISDIIKTKEYKTCPVCRSTGNNLYKSLKDRLFNVSGCWNIEQCTNDKCGLLWLNPMPKVEELPKLYEEYYTHEDQAKKQKGWLTRSFLGGRKLYLKNKYGYSYQETWLDKIFVLIVNKNTKWIANLDFSVFYLNALPKGKMLEIGCGNGEMLNNMRDMGWQVTGLDFDPKSVEVAQKKGLNVLLGDIFQQDFANNSFDAIVMSHVIEHVPDPIGLLTKCNHLLRPNGKLVSITPNTNGYIHKKFKESCLHLDPPRHLHLFNIDSLSKAAKHAGFNEPLVFSTIRDFSGLWWASQSIKKNGQFTFGTPIPMIHKLKIFIKKMTISRKKHFNGDELVIIAKKS